MDQKVSLSPEQYELLYPLTVGLSKDGWIVYASEKIRGKIKGMDIGVCFDDLFEVRRPRLMRPVAEVDLLKYTRNLILFTSLDGRFALRGQVIPGVYEGREIVLMALSPWLTWLKENFPQYRCEFF